MRFLLMKGFLARVGFQEEYKYSLVSSCCPLTLISNNRVHSVPTIATQRIPYSLMVQWWMQY